MASKPSCHILVCASFRVSGDPKGVCHKKGSTGLLQYIEEGLLDRGIDGLVCATGCMKQCDDGPIMVVYPQGHWYKAVDSEGKIDEILDACENGEAAEDHLLFK
ncbi:(2Fe-2S) ferredoxin domain-containing protein [Desulfocurvibacter africanus]|uniref:2Fe-2S ferredoxin n=1 Tax=Desulfocurvibacter africanus subsp. africanus str. Walvis Bay TaxID=690850 RepID=F3YUU5_DESAF|nr:(2Fe-2S) ferredoxin domain-containing protein [Desulfocurvibacter africanus]EGJ49122.1 2Fe-2S ferredoxin [Desulfocurvibacter africanus subsp. africanus str. Walvis Bay]